MEIRCGMKKLGDREKKYVHMLNATLCATGRAICCLLETYQVRHTSGDDDRALLRLSVLSLMFFIFLFSYCTLPFLGDFGIFM